MNWNLADRAAHLTTERLAAQLELDHPERGFVEAKLAGAPCRAEVFQLLLGEDQAADESREVADAYVRGTDLVALYAPCPAFPFQAQIYWRAVQTEGRHGALAAIDLVVSVQTSLLDSRPQVEVGCTAPGESLWLVPANDGAAAQPLPWNTLASSTGEPLRDAACILACSPGASYSLAMMVHPDDGQGAIVSAAEEGSVRIAFPLFSRFLEKGVILRARLRCVFFDPAQDTGSAAAWLRDLSSAELPLTT